MPTVKDSRLTISSTLRCSMRGLRNQDASRDYILAVVQPSQLSWPEFRRTAADANRWIAEWVESMKIEVDADEIVLACHSGGGSFLWGWMKAYDELPEHLHRLIFLDANYSFSIEEGHDRKLVQWLSRSKENVLVVIAYDDREIQLNGKQVVGADGGTYRASERMLNSLSATIEFSDMTEGSFRNRIGLDGRVQLLVHQNPDNKILHTALVGEMNGVAVGMSLASKKIDPIIRLSEPRVMANGSKPSLSRILVFHLRFWTGKPKEFYWIYLRVLTMQKQGVSFANGLPSLNIVRARRK